MIQSFEEVRALRDELDDRGGKLVLTNGCFDLLHAGHVRYLAAARGLGDALVVALNSDESVRALKGPDRPLNRAEDRAEVLAGLRSVDAVTVFDGERATAAIEAIAPHVYAKGGDYTLESLNPEERRALEAAGSRIEILPLVPGKSTSATISNLRRGDAGGRKLRLGVLGSGSGSNMASILSSIENGDLDNAEIVLVISDVEEARILDRARAAGLPAVFVHPGKYKTKLDEPAQKEIADRLTAAGVDLVCLAGFMRIIKPPLLDRFQGRIINIHPSLLPRHKGLAAWKQALEAGDSDTGCTVHYVDAGTDTGEIIAQRSVAVLPGDTPASLHARIQEQEHVIYPEVIRRLATSLLQ